MCLIESLTNFSYPRSREHRFPVYQAPRFGEFHRQAGGMDLNKLTNTSTPIKPGSFSKANRRSCRIEKTLKPAEVGHQIEELLS